MSYAQVVAGKIVMPDRSKNVPLIMKPKEKQIIEKIEVNKIN